MDHIQFEKLFDVIFERKDLDEINDLIDKMTEHPDTYCSLNNHGRTILYCLCEYYGVLTNYGRNKDKLHKIFKKLLNRGADPFGVGRYRQTGGPFICDAAIYRLIEYSNSCGQEEALRIFLEHGMEPNYKYEEKNWVLLHALQKGKYALFKLYVDFGADINLPVKFRNKLMTLKQIYPILYESGNRSYDAVTVGVLKIKELLGFGLTKDEQLSIKFNIPIWQIPEKKEQLNRLQKQEAERLAKEEAEKRAKEEAERLAKEEAERLAKEETERHVNVKEETEMLAKEEDNNKRGCALLVWALHHIDFLSKYAEYLPEQLLIGMKADIQSLYDASSNIMSEDKFRSIVDNLPTEYIDILKPING